MKKSYSAFFLAFIVALVFTYFYWEVDGFKFFQSQVINFYFQFWVSLAGVLFSLIMSITTYILYKQTNYNSLKYIPLSFLLTALAYTMIGYHSSYCKVCSDLAFCAASHNYPNYLILITFVIFVLSTLLFSPQLKTQSKISILQKFSYGLIFAIAIMLGILLLSLNFMEIPNTLEYSLSKNLQAITFMMPVVIIIAAFLYFRRKYKATNIYLLMSILSTFSFLPQIYHIYTCNDCHTMECSEFYTLSGFIMFLVSGLLIYSVSIQLKETNEENL